MGGEGTITLSAVDTWEIRGVTGPDYKVGPRCSNPNCHRWAEHGHHIVRRSKIGGDFKWVEIQGETVGNLTGLCPRCHDDITGMQGGHKAAIRYLDGQFVWCLLRKTPDGIEYLPTDPLEPQPPSVESLASLRATDSSAETCPTCGQAKRRRPTSPRTPGRRRKSWTIKVPDDAEDGAEILDTLVDDLGIVMGIEPNQTGRYFVVLPCVYYAHQDKKKFLESLAGIGG